MLQVVQSSLVHWLSVVVEMLTLVQVLVYYRSLLVAVLIDLPVLVFLDNYLLQMKRRIYTYQERHMLHVRYRLQSSFSTLLHISNLNTFRRKNLDCKRIHLRYLLKLDYTDHYQNKLVNHWQGNHYTIQACLLVTKLFLEYQCLEMA
jgi:hypothetical protein